MAWRMRCGGRQRTVCLHGLENEMWRKAEDHRSVGPGE